MNQMTQTQKLEAVVRALELAGYNPKAQLTGYLLTGDATYITRQGGARRLVTELSEAVMKAYLTENSQFYAA